MVRAEESSRLSREGTPGALRRCAHAAAPPHVHGTAGLLRALARCRRLLVKPMGGWPSVSTVLEFDLVIVSVLTAFGLVALIVFARLDMRASRIRELLEMNERGKVEHELEVSRAAKEARSSLIRSVMHDLRSPIVAIGIAATQLRNALPGVPAHSLPQIVETLLLCAQFSEEMLSDILDWERVRARHRQPLHPPDCVPVCPTC